VGRCGICPVFIGLAAGEDGRMFVEGVGNAEGVEEGEDFWHLLWLIWLIRLEALC